MRGSILLKTVFMLRFLPAELFIHIPFEATIFFHSLDGPLVCFMAWSNVYTFLKWVSVCVAFRLRADSSGSLERRQTNLLKMK